MFYNDKTYSYIKLTYNINLNRVITKDWTNSSRCMESTVDKRKIKQVFAHP